MLPRKSQSKSCFCPPLITTVGRLLNLFAEIDTNLAPNNSNCISNSQYLSHNLEISQIQQHQDTETTTSPSMTPIRRPLRAGIASEHPRTMVEAVLSITGSRNGRLLVRSSKVLSEGIAMENVFWILLLVLFEWCCYHFSSNWR